ncbi:PAS domain-containing protein [Streptomyces griseobrunneus]
MNATRAADAADFRGPLDISRAATVVLDGRDTVVGWSPAATALLGYSPREAAGRPLSAFLGPPPAEGALPGVSDRPAAAGAPAASGSPGAPRARSAAHRP